jgi:hypothetical protein
MAPNIKKVGGQVAKAGAQGQNNKRNYDKPWLVPEKKEP